METQFTPRTTDFLDDIVELIITKPSMIRAQQTCSSSSSFDVKGDHSRIRFKLEDQSSCELNTIGSAQWFEMSKSIYKGRVNNHINRPCQNIFWSTKITKIKRCQEPQ